MTISSYTDAIIDYINKNKEWIFSGVGIFALTRVLWVFRQVLFRKRNPSAKESQSKELKYEDRKSSHWDVIKPPGSKFKFFFEKSDSIPAGVQTFAFEYGPHGHAHPLNLKGKSARVEILFSCRLTNPYKAMFEVNEYALNFLQPQFLIEARVILEKYSANALQEKREYIAKEIVAQQSEKFDKFGFALQTVSIGAIELI